MYPIVLVSRNYAGDTLEELFFRRKIIKYARSLCTGLFLLLSDEGVLKSSWSDYDAMVEFDEMWLISNIVSPAVHTSSIGVAELGFCGIEALILILETILNWRYDLIIGPIPLLKCFFHVMEQNIVNWCQIRRIWRVINQFK